MHQVISYQMNIKDILSATYIALSKLSKNRLLRVLQSLREKYTELEEKIKEVETENAKLKADSAYRSSSPVNYGLCGKGSR